MLSLKNKVLLSVCLNINFLDLEKRLLPVPIRILVNSLSDIKREAVLNTFFKLQEEGLVSKSSLGKMVYVSLTKRGIERMAEGIKFIKFLREKWDGKLRLVLFDIPEEERKLRDGLRRTLLEIGFASWQKSVYVSCFGGEEVLEKIRRMGVSDKVNLMFVNEPAGQDLSKLVWDVWGLESLNKGYNFFISQSRSLLDGKVSNRKSWVPECQRLRFEYYELLCQEPFLPFATLRGKYLLREASGCFLDLGKKLLGVLEGL